MVCLGLWPYSPGVTDVDPNSDHSINIDGTKVTLNTDYNWTNGVQFLTNGNLDVESILVHEIGHVYGLAHPLTTSYDNNSSAPTMAGADAIWHRTHLDIRTLEAADIEATQFLQFGVPFHHSTIQDAISEAQNSDVSNVFVVDYNTLDANINIPSGITLNLLSNSIVDLDTYFINLSGGNLVIDNGAQIIGTKVYLKNNSTIKGYFTSIQSALNNSSYNQTIELLPGTTYSENISISSKPSRKLIGASDGTSIINGNITITNSNDALLSNLKMHTGHTITVNGGTYVNVSYINYMGSSTAVYFYNGTSSVLGGISVSSGSTEPACYYYNTSGDVRGINVSNHDFGVWATSNASLNVSLSSVFCNNLLDLYASSGGYIYAPNNYISAPWPQSVAGNVSGYSAYTCSQLSKTSTFVNNLEDDPLSEDLQALNTTYTALLHTISKENEEKTSTLVGNYKSEFDGLIVGYKDLLKGHSDGVVTTAILSKIEKCYYATEDQNEFETYIKTLLSDKSYISLYPYIERYFVNLYLNRGENKKAIEVCNNVLSTKGINEALTCEMLYEKGIIYKYCLEDDRKANELFIELVTKYPKNDLVRFAERELEQEGIVLPKSHAESQIIDVENSSSYFVENYPNPFNPSTTINYTLPTSSNVKIVIYDVMGRSVKALISESQSSGTHKVIWDGTNSNGVNVSSGIYFYRFESLSHAGKKPFIKSSKLLLVK